MTVQADEHYQNKKHNPYRSPERADRQDLSEQEGHHRRFRKRLLPATLLWSFSPLILLGYLYVIGAFIYDNIHRRWIEPDLDGLRYFNQRALSPPIVAHFIFGIAGAFCGIFAASAWMRGKWHRAVVLTCAFFLFMAFAGYIIGKIH